MNRDPYLYPGTDVLINKGNFRTQEDLDAMEADYVSARIKSLMVNPLPGKYDFSHLCNMHHWIFQDVYEWAGKPRVMNIEKSELVLGGISVEYSDYKNIEKDSEYSIKSLSSVKWHELDIDSAAFEFSKHMAQLWKVHGFREGNTRTVVTFFCLYAAYKNIPLEPELFEKHSAYVRNALVAASAVFKDLGDRSNLSYLQRIVKDSMERGLEKSKTECISERLKEKKLECDRLNSEHRVTKTISAKYRGR